MDGEEAQSQSKRRSDTEHLLDEVGVRGVRERLVNPDSLSFSLFICDPNPNSRADTLGFGLGKPL